MIRLKTLIAGALLMSSVAFIATGAPRTGNTFQNTEVAYANSLGKLADITRAYFSAERASPAPTAAMPLRKLDAHTLPRGEDDAIVRLGHSSMLIQLDGQTLLIDPVFSERASPVQWAGPKRFHPVPVEMDALPRIAAVIISHDHYDHLDKATIQALTPKVDRFVVPLKVGAHLRDWGVPAAAITELDWWQDTTVGPIRLTATPAQHFSGRGLFDKDHTLWASWVIAGTRSKLFFSGDSGYFGGFKTIGDRFGPFDVTMIETGAYNPLWSEIHMLPEQSVQAHRDLRGKAMLPIHNSTFDLALHDWHERYCNHPGRAHRSGL